MATCIAETGEAGPLSPGEAKVLSTEIEDYAAMKSVPDAACRNRYFFHDTLAKIFHDTGSTLIDGNTSHIHRVVTGEKIRVFQVITSGYSYLSYNGSTLKQDQFKI